MKPFSKNRIDIITQKIQTNPSFMFSENVIYHTNPERVHKTIRGVFYSRGRGYMYPPPLGKRSGPDFAIRRFFEFSHPSNMWGRTYLSPHSEGDTPMIAPPPAAKKTLTSQSLCDRMNDNLPNDIFHSDAGNDDRITELMHEPHTLTLTCSRKLPVLF